MFCYPFGRAHSLRYGEITELYAKNFYLLLQKYSRQVPKSKTTFLYTKLQSQEETDLVDNKIDRYYSKI